MTTLESRIRGSLLGGAVGDALGAPLEFLQLDEIHRIYGPNGMTGEPHSFGPFTDDTQMTLFTAEGLIRAHLRWLGRGLCNVPSVVRHAYLRWLETKGETSEVGGDYGLDVHNGWLIDQRELWQRMGPGRTCLTALRAGGLGRVDSPDNNSKGCGGVMRMAPVGLIARRPFELGCELAAITHGHPSGYLAAGALASMIYGLRQDHPLELAIGLG